MKRARFFLVAVAMVVGACSSPETSLDGAVIFANNCGACHAADLSGTVRAPSLEAGSEFGEHSDAEYAAAIRSGRKLMPSFRELSEPQVDAVIAYLRQLQQQ